MTPSARIASVLELLAEIDKTPRPADALASVYFRARRYIGSHDRAAIAAMLYDVLRHRMRLEWWVNFCNRHPREGGDPSPAGTAGKKSANCDSDAEVGRWMPACAGMTGITNSRLRLLAYLILVEGKSAKQAGELFSDGKFAPTPFDDAEKKLARALENHTTEHPDMPDAVKAECPDWAARALQKRFGKDFGREMAALLEEAPLDLRVNTIKTTRDEALAELQKLGLKAEACRLSPFGIRVTGRPSLATLPLLKDGRVEIQDEGSQLVALLVDAKPGLRVVDFCAGAGGKTLAIAMQMKNKGRITACDVLEKRLKRSSERFRRAGLHNIEVKPLASEGDAWVKRHKDSFDRVLVDAPCSGTGTWRRNPDARHRLLGPGLENLLPLQEKILAAAARLVKPGGRLVYATCSLLPDENGMQIEKFLVAHPDFQLLDCMKILEEALAGLPPLAGSNPHGFDARRDWVRGGGVKPETPSPAKTRDLLRKSKFSLPLPQGERNSFYLSLTPLRNDTDGFFAAVMERKKT